MSVTALPIYNLHDIPDALRAPANRIEHGEIDAMRCVVILEAEGAGRVEYKAFGAEPFTNAHAVGMCAWAMKEIME